MEHEDWLAQMSAALDGELSPEDRRALDRHLAQCPHCAALFRELSGQSEALRGLDCTPPADLKDRILSHLPPQETSGKKGRVIRWRRWGALAACLALVVLASVVVPWGGTTSSAGPAPAAFRSGSSSSSSKEFVSRALISQFRLADPLQSPADTSVVFARLPRGWKEIVPGVASPDRAILTGQDALAFVKLLDEQGISYTVKGDDSFSGDCQLFLAK